MSCAPRELLAAYSGPRFRFLVAVEMVIGGDRRDLRAKVKRNLPSISAPFDRFEHFGRAVPLPPPRATPPCGRPPEFRQFAGRLEGASRLRAEEARHSVPIHGTGRGC